ncbi:hypothetical protein [Labedaea rhizosphaerae]|uniref:Uncharacterized protein n=1 Tax=Labedaea rhizosphaerae TaxID=598644 RepID=A0A4R6S5N8_LABRH|nr:hypothetical protein [Labedaea rhizosphaerae]TDP94076.1 hypothetical protein EV186_106470 [Labedaea rhizosphaerae]
MTFDPIAGITHTAAERLADRPDLQDQVESTARLAWAVFTEMRDNALEPTRDDVYERLESDLPVDRVVINAVADALFNS